MKKQLLFLGLSILLLVSCGSEVTEVKKKEGYIYVEIEECSIPIPKRYREIKNKNTPQYNYQYVYGNGKIDPNMGVSDGSMIFTQKRLENSYEKFKQLIKRLKTAVIDRETRDDDFTIIETYTQYKKKSYTYYLLGIKTSIVLANSNEEQLDYLLKYCKKTWKLNKGENNASTPK